MVSKEEMSDVAMKESDDAFCKAMEVRHEKLLKFEFMV